MDQKRKDDYTEYFNSHLGIIQKYREKFEKSVERVDIHGGQVMCDLSGVGIPAPNTIENIVPRNTYLHHGSNITKHGVKDELFGMDKIIKEVHQNWNKIEAELILGEIDNIIEGSFYDTVVTGRCKIHTNTDTPIECTCPTHACEKSCNKDCDNPCWHKPMKT